MIDTDPQQPIPEIREVRELQFISSSRSDAESPHKENQDSFFDEPRLRAFGVFDGMGGHQGGSRASRIARDVILEHIRLIPAEADGIAILDALDAAYEDANDKIREEAKQMGVDFIGTTASMIMFRMIEGVEDVFIAHIGDSRVYRLRDGLLSVLTRDHGVIRAARDLFAGYGLNHKKVAAQLDNAQELSDITDPLVRELFSQRHSLTHALGINEKSGGDVDSMETQDGDIYIVCSDGISDNLTPAQIEDLAKRYPNPALLSTMLVENAQHVASSYRKSGSKNVRAKPDDMTVVVVAAHAR